MSISVGLHSDCPLRLTKPHTIADGTLGKQDGPASISPDVIQDLAEPDPAGVHSIQDVGGGHVSVDDPERDGIERNLEDTRTPPPVI